MKLGTIVAVCHQGKWGRRAKGIVVGTRKGHHIKVEFPHPETEEPVIFWARKIPKNKWNYKRFGGWANIDWFMPWYSVCKWKEHA